MGAASSLLYFAFVGRIYRYQTFDYSFSTTESLLHAMGGNDFISKLNMTIDEAMQKSGFTQRFIDDIVVPAMRVNYGQGVKINGFVGKNLLCCRIIFLIVVCTMLERCFP